MKFTIILSSEKAAAAQTRSSPNSSNSYISPLTVYVTKLRQLFDATQLLGKPKQPFRELHPS